MKLYVKPSGAVVTVNESSEAHAVSLGWAEKKDEAEKPEIVKEAPRRGRPPKY